MDLLSFISLVAPILLSFVVTWLPSLCGDFIDFQAHAIIDDFSKSGMSRPHLTDIAEAAGSLARGATLASGGIAMIPTYVYSAWGVLAKIKDPTVWIAATSG